MTNAFITNEIGIRTIKKLILVLYDYLPILEYALASSMLCIDIKEELAL